MVNQTLMCGNSLLFNVRAELSYLFSDHTIFTRGSDFLLQRSSVLKMDPHTGLGKEENISKAGDIIFSGTV